DGNRLAYVDDGTLLTREITSGLTKRLAKGMIFSVAGFSPDGKMIFYLSADPISRRAATYRISVDGGEPVKVFTDSRGYFVLSPDGKSVAVIRNEGRTPELGWSLNAVSLDGSNERRLATWAI